MKVSFSKSAGAEPKISGTESFVCIWLGFAPRRGSMGRLQSESFESNSRLWASTHCQNAWMWSPIGLNKFGWVSRSHAYSSSNVHDLIPLRPQFRLFQSAFSSHLAPIVQSPWSRCHSNCLLDCKVHWQFLCDAAHILIFACWVHLLTWRILDQVNDHRWFMFGHACATFLCVQSWEGD